jgi:hypothetical protein
MFSATFSHTISYHEKKSLRIFPAFSVLSRLQVGPYIWQLNYHIWKVFPCGTIKKIPQGKKAHLLTFENKLPQGKKIKILQ